MERLAERTGLSRASLYRYIGNKAQLLDRLAREGCAAFGSLATRERILQGARKVFGREGLAAATMEQIAREAGVGVATVYRLFGSKEGLLQAFSDEMIPRSMVQELAIHPTENVTRDLEAIVRVILGFFYENRDVVRLALLGNEAERQYLRRLRGRSDTARDYLAEYLRRQIEAGRLKETGPPEDLALALIGMVLAFAVVGPLHYHTEPGSLEQTARFLVTVFLDDLKGGSK